MSINEERAKQILSSLGEGEEIRLLTNPYNPGVTRVDVMWGYGAESRCYLEKCHRGYKKALKMLHDSQRVTIEDSGRFW